VLKLFGYPTSNDAIVLEGFQVHSDLS